MTAQVHRVEKKIGDRTISIETGKMAKQADGAVLVQCEGTMVLVAACCARSMRPGGDFLPLTIEYQEKTYAAGKIPGGFFKREGKPSEKAILTARLIDRPIRPLFPKGFSYEVQVMATVLSCDGENDPDILALIGASAALCISPMPFKGPIGSVRVGLVDGEYVINPTSSELAESPLDLVVCGLDDRVIMMEGGANEVSEECVIDAIAFAQKHLVTVNQLQQELIKLCGKPKRAYELTKLDEQVLKNVTQKAEARFTAIHGLATKEERLDATELLSKELIAEMVTPESGVTEAMVKESLYQIERRLVREMVIKKKRRFDGRAFDEIRPISIEVGMLPRTHGSALFTRGQTQSLAVTTLGTADDEQIIDDLTGEGTRRFMLHYNFPPFSVGEVKPVRGPGRREIGHGALAARALAPLMPSEQEFPYTVRLVSDILESNGSSSMATVCAGSLSLMDAGVPVRKAVAGIAMGLVKEGDTEALLTDIAGIEDHFGDMDFKIAGTRDGITAIQLDLKIDGVSYAFLKRGVLQAKQERDTILTKMQQAIAKPREKISEFAPRIVTFKISVDVIKNVIGPGGKTIKKIIADTGVSINIEDDGTVQVASVDSTSLEQAISIIRGITEPPEVGRIYVGRITKTTTFGAFCEIAPGKEGLIHVSELANGYVKKVEDVVKAGDEVRVKVLAVDEAAGKVSLSKKQVDLEQQDASGKDNR